MRPTHRRSALSDAIDFGFVARGLVWSLLGLLSLYTASYVAYALGRSEWLSTTHVVGSPVFSDSPLLSNLVLLGHILLAIPCLVAGPFLFMRRFRNRFRRVHRVLGNVYVFTVLPSAVLGFVLAVHNPNGPGSQMGFGTLAVVWFTTTWVAWRQAMGRDWHAHRRWMIRSYLISIAVITVRFLARPEGIDHSTWFTVLTWLCWVPNAIVAEIYVRLTPARGLLSRMG